MPEAAVAPAPTAAVPTAVPGGVAPVVPAKPLSARQQMTKAIWDKAGQQQTAPPSHPQPAEPTPEPPKPGEQQPPKPADPTPEPDPKAAKGGAAQAWKLYDAGKKRITALEIENLELKGRIAPENDVKEYREKLAKAESRLKEYEDEIRHVNYTKSDEFKQKYVAPYESEWRRVAKDITGIYITGEDGQKRAMTTQDMLALVNMELGPARELADATFGAFSDDVMRHRSELRRLADAQLEAIGEARKTGAEREKTRTEEMTRGQQALAAEITKVWKDANDAVIKDPEIASFFGPREGDKDWNERLEKGFAMVDRAFSEDPRNPKLTAAERREIIKRHTAVRNRAAGWGALRNDYIKLQKEIEGLKKALEGYKSSTPGNGSGTPGGTPAAGTARDRIAAGFTKYAK